MLRRVGAAGCPPCRIEVVSLHPRAYVLHGFLSDEGGCWGGRRWQGSAGQGSELANVCLLCSTSVVISVNVPFIWETCLPPPSDAEADHIVQASPWRMRWYTLTRAPRSAHAWHHRAACSACAAAHALLPPGPLMPCTQMAAPKLERSRVVDSVNGTGKLDPVGTAGPPLACPALHSSLASWQQGQSCRCWVVGLEGRHGGGAAVPWSALGRRAGACVPSVLLRRRPALTPPPPPPPQPPQVRTSSGTFLAKGADEVVARIERRVATATHLPVSHAENIQVLRCGWCGGRAERAGGGVQRV